MDALIHSRNWVTRAACQKQPELWFASEASARAQARHICETHCPVYTFCRAEADRQPCGYSIHAGVLYKSQIVPEPDAHQPAATSRYCLTCQPDSKAAKAMARRRIGEDHRLPPTTRAACGTSGGYERHREHGEHPCEPCRDANRARKSKRRAAAKSKVRCGTLAGYRRHHQLDEQPCRPCQVAQDEYNLRAATRRFGYSDPAAYLETVETVRKLAGERWTDREIAERLGVAQRKVLRLRRYNKIPPGVGRGGAWAQSHADRSAA